MSVSESSELGFFRHDMMTCSAVLLYYILFLQCPGSHIFLLETPLTCSDVPILGLRPRTARTEGFLGGPRPYKDRSSKTERPAGFFGPKIS